MSAPQKPSKPGLVRVFKALYTYEATEPDEVSFKEGDVLYIPATEISGEYRMNFPGVTFLHPLFGASSLLQLHLFPCMVSNVWSPLSNVCVQSCIFVSISSPLQSQ